MRDIRPRTIATLLCLYCATVAYAQQPQPTAAVPKLVRFSGSFRPVNGMPVQSVESVTLAVYRDQTGGNALWHEIQNVAVDTDAHYSLLMGATQNDGMPLELFASGEPRWLGAQFNRPGETEQPRVLLVSVPYALKASDAETLGGRPASAYLLAGAPASTNTGLATSNNTATPVKSTKATPLASSGMPNFIGKFVNATDLVDSVMYEINGGVGIGTTSPLISLDVRTGSLPQMGIAGTTDYLTFFASDTFGPAIYWDPAKDMRFGKGGASLYNPFGFVEQMRIQSSTGNVGIGTMAPGSKLDVAGDINFFNGVIRYHGNPVLQTSDAINDPNIALGVGALASNTSGVGNTAIGGYALQHNTSANNNTAIGNAAMQYNTTGVQNTAIGEVALQNNTIGFNNTGCGAGTLAANTAGNTNTASGVDALSSNTTGDNNTASGVYALQFSTTGSQNTATGYAALQNNTSGNNNIAIGYQAAASLSAGNSNNIHIGSPGTASDSNIIRIGNFQSSFFAAGVRGVSTSHSDAIPVMIDSAGQLGTVSSSRRFKEDIEDMGAASHDLMRLRPVTYRYKQPFADGSKPIQYGLIAEEVAEVYPDLVAHSADGQIETVKYQVLDSMLLNEVQRQQAEIRGLEQQNRILQERLAKLETALTSMSRASEVTGVR